MKKRLSVLLIFLAFIFAIGGHTQAALPTDINQPQPAPSPLNIYALDIGQGDSLLIVSPTGKTVLIDAGDTGNAPTILNALATHAGAKKIDLFIASHPHQDHIGSAVKVFKASTLASVLDSGFTYSTDSYQKYLETVKAKGAKYIPAAPGQHFDIGGGAVITVLAPFKPFFTQNQLHQGATVPNANSVVVRLDYNNFSMIFTGDAEGETEARMIANKEKLKATILKVGHHGSRNATSDAFLLKVKPEAAIISCGADNDYGHPTDAALMRLKQKNVKVFRTDLQGEINITSDGNTYQIKTEKEASDADIFTGRG